ATETSMSRFKQQHSRANTLTAISFAAASTAVPGSNRVATPAASLLVGLKNQNPVLERLVHGGGGASISDAPGAALEQSQPGRHTGAGLGLFEQLLDIGTGRQRGDRAVA